MRPVGRRAAGVGSLTLALILALNIACGGDSPGLGNPERGQVRGMVLEVVGRSIVEWETLWIRDETGRGWTFRADQGFIGFNLSHLRGHQVAGKSVLVTYVTRGDELLAVDITD